MDVKKNKQLIRLISQFFAYENVLVNFDRRCNNVYYYNLIVVEQPLKLHI